MKKSHVFLAVLVLLAVAAGVMLERNTTGSDTSKPPEAISAYPVDDWYTVEPTVVFPAEAYPMEDYSGYPAPYWDDTLPTPAPEPELGGYPAP